MGETPVLQPGGFWVCPVCGMRNKAWAPCANCGTALSGMGAMPEGRSPAPRKAGRRWLPYGFIVAGLLTSAGVALALCRLLGGAAFERAAGQEAEHSRAAATPMAPPPSPWSVPGSAPERAPVLLPPPSSLLPAPESPPAAGGAPLDAPRPHDTPEGPRLTVRREGDIPRGPDDELRDARREFEEAQAGMERAGGGKDEKEAMERLEEAARRLRRAEAALDLARPHRRR